MMFASQSRLIIISAPSGAGKTSLSKRLIAEHNDVKIAVSHTTRVPRCGEVDGRDYYFVQQSKFNEIIAQQGFLEYAEVFDHYYGTSKMAVQQLLDEGMHVLLEIDWQGAQNIRKLMPDSISIFILPPSNETLFSRLTARGQDSAQIIKRRMRDAINQISHFKEYDYVIINDDFDKAYSQLQGVVYGQSDLQELKPEAVGEFVDQLVKD